ncbi:MAG: amidohydrolase family protein [Kiritimatiellae bacterium]|nr:amidohydrolase family protein [Kiritimatiellia bacterium]
MKKIALINGRIIDGRGGPPIEHGTLIMGEGRLERVGPTTAVTVPEGYQVIDIRGKTVLPALIDGHMHVGGEPGRLDPMGHILTNLQAIGKLQNCLRWGTGTVAHAAGSPESMILGNVIRNGQVHGCSDLLIGAAVTATCGHVRGRSADGPWEVRKAVREMIAAGADFIKTCSSGGFQWEHEKLTHEDYSREELQALVGQAHSRDKRVHVHAHAQPGLANAITAGCDVILHGALIDDAALEGIAAKGLWYMPTLYITSEQARKGKHWPAYMTERMKAAHPIHCAGVAKAHKMGIKIVTGTDGGPGSIMNELHLLVGCGLSPMEALVASTRSTADVLGILERTGTLEAGKKADLFVVNGNPLQDIEHLASQDSIFLVIKNGIIQMAGAFDPNETGKTA